jgi:MbtH protein
MADRPYAVVRNDEEQYSIWPVGRPAPDGWEPDGFTGTRAECLAHVESVWTDIRPRTVRAVSR